MKRTVSTGAAGGGNPVIVRQISIPAANSAAAGQSSNSAAAASTAIHTKPQQHIISVSGGEIPKRIEKSELSPSTELDVETDT